MRLEKDTSRIPSDVQRCFIQGGLRPGKECDAYLYEAIRHSGTGKMERTREQVYRDWLQGQIERRGGALERRGGASLDLDSTRLVSYQRTRAYRKSHRRHTEGPDAVLQGVLTVTEPSAFTALLGSRHRTAPFLWLRNAAAASGPPEIRLSHLTNRRVLPTSPAGVGIDLNQTQGGMCI